MKPSWYWEERLKPIPFTSDFRRNGSTVHFDVNYGMWTRGHLKTEMNKAAKSLGPLLVTVPEKIWLDSPIGQPPMIDGMTLTSLHFAYVLSFIGVRKAPRVLDIGCGFGGLARALLTGWPEASITLCDFEPMLDLQKAYLLHTTGLDGRASFIKAGGEPGDQLYDFVVSMNSMCEMDIDQANFYVDLAERVLVPGGYFISVNHLECVNKQEDWKWSAGWQVLEDRPFPHLPNKRGYLTIKKWADRKSQEANDAGGNLGAQGIQNS